ncbi:MAG: AsmA family protein [Porticoccaceae bacterium]|nr:AsmA family protein [Porticoccaceae bacterium]
MRKVTKIVSAIILLAVALLVFVIINLDRGIKTAVETIGPEMTQSQVTLSSVDLSLTTAKGRFSGLRVGNPEGFAAANAFTLGEISFAMNADSLATDTIIIESLRIVAPEITMERADGRSNLDQIQSNIAAYLGTGSEQSSTGESGKKFIIRDLRITDGKVHYAILGGKGIDLALPDLQLTDIGQSAEGNKGVSGAEAAGEIISAIVGAAGKAVSQSGAVRDLGRSLEDQVKEKAGALKGLFDRKK